MRRKKDAEGGFSYTCLLSDFSCVGRKGIMEYLKEKHEVEYLALQEEVGAELGKLVMNAAFLEEKKEVKAAAKTNGVAKTNGMTEEMKAKAAEKAKALEEKKALQQAARDKATAERLAAEEKRMKVLEEERKRQKELEEKKKAELEAEEEEKRVEEEAAAAGRVDYPMTMEVLRKIDARTIRIPEYGSLAGRLARLLAVVVGKKDGVTYDFKKDKPIGDIMAHLVAEHSDFLELLYTIFPQAKKRMGQFVEKAAERFELRVPTAREVDKLEAEGKRKEQERVKKEREEEQARIKKERDEEIKKVKETREAEEKEREARRLKRKLEWEETRKEMEAKRRKIQEEAERKRNTPETTEEMIKRLKKEQRTLTKALKKMKTAPEFKKKALEKRFNETKQKLTDIFVKRYNKQQDDKTAAILEKLSPKQLRKLCMAYFGNLAEEGEKVTWKDTMESIKMEVDYSFLVEFLILLHHHAKVNFKKTFKFGHMLVTSKQSELIFTRGLRPVSDGVKDDSWRLPSSWEVDNPPEELGEEWNRKHDSRLIIACSRRNFVFMNSKVLAKVATKYPDMKKMVLDEEGGLLPQVKDRGVYLINVYTNRGVYSEEFGDVFFKEGVEDEDVDAEDDLVEDEVMEVTEEDSSNGTKAEASDTKEPVVVADESSEAKEVAPAEVLAEAVGEVEGVVEMTEAEENELLGDDATEEDM